MPASVLFSAWESMGTLAYTDDTLGADGDTGCEGGDDLLGVSTGSGSGSGRVRGVVKNERGSASLSARDFGGLKRRT